ncbi:hypothetical protein BaRGS_00003647 [Batillaria attramentaria]|uniref:Ig-like domain-containing protein n=1 Tax=Batillaria attramentaria TaxID=370345 RepID=A0ABD0M1H2_9CAEN
MYTTEILDSIRDASLTCSGFSGNYVVTWTWVLDNQTVPGMAGTQPLGYCTRLERRCASPDNTGYWVSRPSSHSSVVTIDATKNFTWVQNGTLTCEIVAQGEKPLNKGCHLIVMQLFLSPCGKDDMYTTEILDSIRDASLTCSGFSGNYAVTWTWVLDNQTVPGMAGTQTLGLCTSNQPRCTSLRNTGYWVSRPSSHSSVVTIDATRNSTWVQNGTLTCEIVAQGEEPLNKSCHLTVTGLLPKEKNNVCKR